MDTKGSSGDHVKVQLQCGIVFNPAGKWHIFLITIRLTLLVIKYNKIFTLLDTKHGKPMCVLLLLLATMTTNTQIEHAESSVTQ